MCYLLRELQEVIALVWELPVANGVLGVTRSNHVCMKIKSCCDGRYQKQNNISLTKKVDSITNKKFYKTDRFFGGGCRLYNKFL